MKEFLHWFATTPPAWLFFFAITVLPIEIYLRSKRGLKFNLRTSTTSFAHGFLYLAIGMIFGRILFLGFAVYIYNNFRLFTFPANTYLWAMVFILYLLLDDFIYYWVHRAEHTYQILWSSHLIHHSATEFSFTTGMRNPWTEVFYKPFIGLWAPLLGANPSLAASLGVVSIMGGLLQHTTIVKRMGIFDKIFMTPLNHGLHHAMNREYLDKNFGGTFILWDMVFGTYVQEGVEPEYGITKPLPDDKILTVAKGGYPAFFKEIKTQVGLKNKLKHSLSKI